jgi:hypothetical protein
VRRATAVVLAVGLASVFLAGCRPGAPDPLVLDGRARRADDVGVVTKVSLDQVVLDGKRTYRVSKKLQCFSTANLQSIPLLSLHNRLVQVGAHDGTVDWVAAFAAVVRVEGQPPTVFYVGRLRSVTGNEARFVDGTVLRLGPQVVPPKPGGQVRADIDPSSGAIRQLVSYN